MQQAHGGIVVDSVPGRGSRFTVYWPRAEAAECAAHVRGGSADEHRTNTARTRKPTSEPRLPQRGTGKSVLIVDDEPALVHVVARMFEGSGYQVIKAASGAEALQLLVEQRRTVHALVSDVRMPNMMGVELVSRLMAAGIDLPVLFISGQLDAPLPSTWPDTVPRRFLPKPFTLEQMRRAVEQLFEAGTGTHAQVLN